MIVNLWLFMGAKRDVGQNQKKSEKSMVQLQEGIFRDVQMYYKLKF